jgi:hypothetical protein
MTNAIDTLQQILGNDVEVTRVGDTYYGDFVPLGNDEESAIAMARELANNAANDRFTVESWGTTVWFTRDGGAWEVECDFDQLKSAAETILRKYPPTPTRLPVLVYLVCEAIHKFADIIKCPICGLAYEVTNEHIASHALYNHRSNSRTYDNFVNDKNRGIVDKAVAAVTAEAQNE